MAFQNYSRKKQQKHENEQSFCRYVVTVFQVFVFCQNVSNIAAQGYLHSTVEADRSVQDTTFFKQHDVKISSETVYLDKGQVVTSEADVIRFEPPFLDFDKQPIGIPNTRIVYVYNPSKTKSLRLNSISARTSHFHSSFFDKKIVSPNGNTSFEVVFLARAIGNVENTLFINTAVGVFSYQVFGVGISNPFRLRPFLGAKVSLNSSFSPLISMHNPTGTPLQVMEMYTSSGYLHLQLPTGLYDGSKKIWEIPPYETKPVMQASFLGQVADNHTAFIRIKTNHTDFAQYLILPMEVEVSSAPGIYSSLEMLDFGTLQNKDKPKVLNLFLLNSGSKEVQITTVTPQPENPAIEIEFSPTKLKPSEAVFTRVANISFNVQRVRNQKQWAGKIIVRTKEKSYSKLSIPYQADVLDGNLGYDESSTYFHISQKNSTPIVKNISLTNTFTFPVVLHKLKLPNDTGNFYKIMNFSSPCLIEPQATITCFTVHCTQSAFHSSGKSVANLVDTMHHVVLHTNVSTFSLPLHTYTGSLMYEIQSGRQEELDFGIMGTLDKRRIHLAIYNHNPLQVSLLDCNSSVKGVEVHVVSLVRESEEIQPIVKSKFQNIILPPASRLVLEVVLSAPKNEVVFSGSLNISTTYEILQIPLKARIAIGSLTLKPAQLNFRPSFPGLTVYQTVTVISSFSQSTKIESLTSEDKRFHYRKHKNVGTVLEPGKELKVGKVYFDSRKDCKPDKCYVGLPTSTTVGHHWLTTLNLGTDAVEIDHKLYKTYHDRWKLINESNKTRVNTTIQLTTSLVRNLDIFASASLYWPSFLRESTFSFPLTHVGKKTISQFILQNPADVPVILQIFPISFYPQPGVVLDALNMTRVLSEDGFILNDTDMFNVSLTSDFSTQDTSPQMMWLEYTLNGKTNRSCVNVFLNPGQKQSIDVTFSPVRDVSVSTIILLRNNLTILEALVVEGRGVKEQLKLGGKLSNNLKDSLKFKLTPSVLHNCDGKMEKTKDPMFTVRKIFTAKNLGLLPLNVRYMMINNFPCEGYGFRISECTAFSLEPNETKDVSIMFSPDFTRSRVLHTLRIVTFQGNILTFILNVSLPHHLLSSCYASLPRPHWEQTLYCFCSFMVVVVLIGIILSAFLEGLNASEVYKRSVAFENKQAHDMKSSRHPDKAKPFNLKEIAENYNGAVELEEENAKSFRSNDSLTSRSKLGFLEKITNTFSVFNRLLCFFKNLFLKNRSKSLPPSEESENILDNIKPAPVLTGAMLNNMKVSNVVAMARTRHKQAKKMKSSNNNAWNSDVTAAAAALAKRGNQEDQHKEPDNSIESSWLQTPLANSEEKSNEDVKNLTDVSSGSSIESSRSRGSSVSSGLSESDKFKHINHYDANKRRRKNKLTRQQVFNRDNDDSSSTAAEKSSEDSDDKLNPANKQDIVHKPKHGIPKTMKLKKRSHSSNETIQESNALYAPGVEQTIRKRHVRQPSRNIASTDQGTSLLSFSSSSQKHPGAIGYDTSSTDDPAWDVPKVNLKQNVDEVMQTLSEQTKQADGKMRVKPSRNKQKPISGKSSSYSSVVSSSNEALNKNSAESSGSQRKRQNFTKAKSVPDAFTPPPMTSSFNTENNLLRSSIDTSSGFSMFTSTTGRDSNSALPPFNAVSAMPVWNNFGQNSFNIAEGLMPHSSSISQPLVPSSLPPTSSWGPYSSSLFSSSTQIPASSNWNRSNILDINNPIPGPPTAPRLPQSSGHCSVWGSPPSPVSRSTHAIWSVSNAVTMDEDRNTTESDPLGLKSIWNTENPPEEEHRDLF